MIASLAFAAVALWAGLRMHIVQAVIFATVLVWWFFNNYTASIQQISGGFVRNQLTLQLTLCALAATLLSGAWMREWKRWYLLQAIIFTIFLAANTQWSSAYRELWTRNFQTREAMRVLTANVPDNSIVIGRRATALLCASRARLGITTSNYAPKDFVEKISVLLKNYSAQPLFWLLDGDGNSAREWRAYKIFGQNQWQVKPVATVYVFSGDALDRGDLPEQSELSLVPIYLTRVGPVR
jgi:hypothetical protein